MKFHVGCSGWSYKHWLGNFYPRGLPASRWLEHYATVFDTVELNGTFYRLPAEKAVRVWHERSPAPFRFSAKASRLITHFRRLRNCEEALDLYVRRIRLLGSKLGPLLFQLPPNFERDTELLDKFLGYLPAGLTCAFEFRNDSWWTEEVYALLRRRDAIFCAFDMGRTRTPFVTTTSAFYIRFHGPEAAYQSGYSQDALEAIAADLRSLPGVDSMWVYFNNDLGGHAPRDALRLRKVLTGH